MFSGNLRDGKVQGNQGTSKHTHKHTPKLQRDTLRDSADLSPSFLASDFEEVSSKVEIVIDFEGKTGEGGMKNPGNR